MAQKNVCKFGLVALILTVSLESTLIEALQCYTCRDCEVVTEDNELQICKELPANNKPTLETDYDGDYSDEDIEDIVRLAGKSKSKQPSVKEDESKEFESDGSEYHNDDDNDSDRRRRKYQLIDGRADDAVCYMIKLNVNGTTVTQRGCSSMVRQNKLLTCESLASAKDVSDCQLCKTNGCNKYFEDDGEWQAFMNNGENLRTKIWFLAFLPFVLLMKY